MRGAPRPATWLAAAALLGGAVDAAAQPQAAWRNVSDGGPLRHGVYGRIEVRGATPPPVIYRDPVIAHQSLERVRGEPVYLYVPPGQVRKWNHHCGKWKACEQPVLFVRMDKSPSQWGRWRHLRDDRDDIALQDRADD